MALQAGNIADLLTTTFENVERLKFTDITSDLQRYTVMSRMVKKDKVQFDFGDEFEWDAMTDDNGSAEFRGLYAQDVVNPTDVMARAKVPWRHISWNWGIERREIAMNRSPGKIVDLYLTRRIAAFVSAVKKFENRFWRCPASTDDVNPFGVPYWIVKNATEGFNGGAPSGYTLVGNLNPSSYNGRWKNWTAQYSAVTQDNLMRYWSKAIEFTDWDTPIDEMPVLAKGQDFGFYTNWAVVGTMRELLMDQNDNLGKDALYAQGKVMVYQTPVTRTPQLEEDTTNPVYGINWRTFKTAGLRGEWLNETRVPIMPGQHTVSANFVDSSLNWFCYNRRGNFVLATGTTMPA